MEDDDEFGDLYSDVLIAPIHQPPKPPRAPAADDDDDDDQILYGSSRTAGGPSQTLAPEKKDGDEDDWLLGPTPVAVEQPENWSEDDDGIKLGEKESRVEKKEILGARVSEIREAEVANLGGEENNEIGDLDQEPIIPGLSTGSFGAPESVGGAKTSRSDDWDSDSDDDLKIVLNDDHRGPLGGEMGRGMGDDDDDDGEEDLVIVMDEDQRHHHLPGTEEAEWGEEGMQVGADGEKEGADGAKANSTVAGAALAARIGYSNHGFHQPHHSMYKYVRPGATPAAGSPMVSSIGVTGQPRPPLATGAVAGRGRGDWRPVGGRGISAARGYGMPGWNNSTGRGFGGGLDFTLPSHKTVFDDQLRLESTMQSKIRVYESGRSEQEYDPDLPPELAAATGLHDVSTEILHRVKVDGGEVDINGQGRGITSIRPPIPTGRAIQVESGCGERLPSIDTRQQRPRDSDSVIEIVCQDAVDDSNTYNGALEQSEYDPVGDNLKGVREVEDEYSEYNGRFVHSFSDRKREMVSRGMSSTPERDGIIPFSSEPPLHALPHSKFRGPSGPSGPPVTDGGRLATGRRQRPSSSMDRTNDVSQSALSNRYEDRLEEKLGESPEHPRQDASPVESTRELSTEPRDYEPEDKIALGDSIELEGEEIASDSRVSPGTVDDDRFVHSAKKQKLSSRVEQPTNQDNGDGGSDDLKATYSDNSRAKSGSGKEYHKRHEGGEEVVQGEQLRRISGMRKRYEEEERNFSRKDDYGRDGRLDIEKSRIAPRGRVDAYHSYPHRDLDSYHPTGGRREGFDRLKDRESSGVWQRREDDVHGRRIKDEDVRRERGDEAGMRNRNKVRLNDRKDKDENHLKVRMDDGDWRGRDREGSSRQRERDDILLNRRANLEDPHMKRRKEEEHSRREKVDKEELHGHRAREDVGRRKREREDAADHRRREDVGRRREKPEEQHSGVHKDENWRQKEREDRHRLKQPHEDAPKHRDREEGRAARNVRMREDKSLGGNAKGKDELKAGVPDKESQQKDRRRHNEPHRRGDKAADENYLQHKGREDMLTRENQSSNERTSRGPSSASDGQQIYRERHRENSRKNNDTETPDQHFPGRGRRDNDDHSTRRTDKVSAKGMNEHESNNAPIPQSKLAEGQLESTHHSSGEHGEDLASDDENQHDSRRGRSKLERWTSHKERDYGALDNLQNTSLSSKAEIPKSDKAQWQELSKTEGNNTGDSEHKDSETNQASGKNEEDHSRHLDTVAKLKRRSERFKLPMPGEKEAPANKKVENEMQTALNETVADAEIKPERPPRKRRWTSS
ncbi:hypothetical protein J5N97_008640 [Dioscorea zingiberensis]|uniref:FIP1[V]-like protein n=1 Tax=Dioscorea zingiberensis TaxID=325984 RepID=A0A9D5HKS3_9LILI|nr:hypothetical protein J5N97_008640 [Dioscorea zingiberensis]